MPTASPGKKARRPAKSLRTAKVARWGNSLGVRLSSADAQRLNIRAGEEVAIESDDESITIRPIRPRRRWTLAEMLKGTKPGALSGEVWGEPKGKERG